MEVHLDGVVEGDENDEVDSAGEPTEIGFEKNPGLCAALWREPIALVGKIDELDGKTDDDERHDETDEDHDQSDDGDGSHEAGLRLPTVGGALGVEVRGDDIGKLRVEQGKVNGGEEDENQEDEFG